ncbi:MAG: lipoyl synthase [Candidatus Woesearchaeota archaeon]
MRHPEASRVYFLEKKPEWLKIKLYSGEKFDKIKNALRKRNLYTVCEESRCPNIPECWSNEGTATFLLMGDVCTRACRFCHIKTAYPAKPLDAEEPVKLAEAIAEMDLDYAVLTSVTRDDLKDGGAAHFASCIREIKKRHPNALIEVLTPDFRGSKDAIKTVVDAKPDVFAHNIETVRDLQKKIRDPRANMDQSLFVLKYVKELDPDIITKSSMMLGIGETEEQIVSAMNELRAAGVQILTLGQYLRPSSWHVPVFEYVHPDKFKKLQAIAEGKGFLFVAAGPFVRSSYRAGELFVKHVRNGKRSGENNHGTENPAYS